ncbi:hypothetical protein [Bradyrhizobium sp.]|uniref:hypothetical protein n=1 Tax=Bradyrhizobium sp. TaxID=376 RepID=UPI00263897F3|nr:hypothetical protein [Bradyrhizobium sp.]
MPTPLWVDPRGIPSLQYLLPRPSPKPGSSLAPSLGEGVNPPADATANWLQSYYDQNFAQQGSPQPDNDIGPTVQDDASQPEVPVRRLGRRTYRS